MELKKPQNRWCTHCTIGAGCTVYETRPPTCRVFECGYLLIDSLPETLRPDRCHAVISFNEDGIPLVHIDPKTPDVYRRGPLAQFIEASRRAGIDVILVSEHRRKLLQNYKQDSPFTVLNRTEVRDILQEAMK